MRERLLTTLSQNHYSDYHGIVSDIAENDGYDMVDVAAAALKLSVEGFKEREEKEPSRFGDTGGEPGMVRAIP